MIRHHTIFKQRNPRADDNDRTKILEALENANPSSLPSIVRNVDLGRKLSKYCHDFGYARGHTAAKYDRYSYQNGFGYEIGGFANAIEESRGVLEESEQKKGAVARIMSDYSACTDSEKTSSFISDFDWAVVRKFVPDALEGYVGYHWGKAGTTVGKKIFKRSRP